MGDTALPLRAHHGMCIRYFKGEGYSSDFTRHMAGVISGLTADTPVRIVCAPDAVCAGCPNLSGGECASQAKALRYDRAVLSLCGLKEGRILPYGEFAALRESGVIAPGKRPAVCPDCEWNDICR